MKINTTKLKIETKNVKHDFTPEERGLMGQNLALAVGYHRGVNAEFDGVKASYKAKLSETEGRIDLISTNLVNGFEMRNEDCVVVFAPDVSKKYYYVKKVVEALTMRLEEAIAAGYINAALVEAMTRDDFQTELLQAEAKFDMRETVDLFQETGNDYGTMIVGKFGGKWFSALRISVGKQKLEERLDSEQKSFKDRADAVRRAGKRALEWFQMTMKDSAKGFEDPIAAAVKAQADRVE